MTWIIGSAALYGSSILVSDICVTFKYTDGTERYIDCLQKIYPLGSSAICGFSGSVNIGFNILGALQDEFSNVHPDAAVDMSVAANTWLPRVVRRQFREALEHEKKLTSSVILASAHPTKNRGNAPWPTTYIHVLASPDFVPQEAEVSAVVAIGRGASVSDYMDGLRALSSDVGFLRASMNSQGQNASQLAHAVSMKIENSPIPGVSRFFQAGVVVRGNHAIWDQEYRIHQADGRAVDRTFPRIARGRQEYDALAREFPGDLQSAQC